MAPGNAASSGAAVARSVGPGPAITTATALPFDNASNAATKRSTGHIFGSQLAVGASAIIGRPAGNSAAAFARSSGAVQTTGSGGGFSPRIAANCSVLCPADRRITARCRVGTNHDKAEPRMSTTRSHQVVATAAHNGNQ